MVWPDMDSRLGLDGIGLSDGLGRDWIVGLAQVRLVWIVHKIG